MRWGHLPIVPLLGLLPRCQLQWQEWVGTREPWQQDGGQDSSSHWCVCAQPAAARWASLRAPSSFRCQIRPATSMDALPLRMPLNSTQAGKKNLYRSIQNSRPPAGSVSGLCFLGVTRMEQHLWPHSLSGFGMGSVSSTCPGPGPILTHHWGLPGSELHPQDE